MVVHWTGERIGRLERARCVRRWLATMATWQSFAAEATDGDARCAKVAVVGPVRRQLQEKVQRMLAEALAES